MKWFWLPLRLVLARPGAVGRTDDAWKLYRAMTALAGPTGLLSEQYGPTTERAHGNFPKCYSHLALIEGALRLAALPPD